MAGWKYYRWRDKAAEFKWLCWRVKCREWYLMTIMKGEMRRTTTVIPYCSIHLGLRRTTNNPISRAHFLSSIKFRYLWIPATQFTLLLLEWFYSPCGPSPLFQFPDLFYSQSAGLLEWVISSSQGLYQNFGREMADNFCSEAPLGLEVL
jgi:hypothetical protein